MDTPSSVVIEQLYLALEKSQDANIKLACLLVLFVFISVGLLVWGWIGHKKEKELQAENDANLEIIKKIQWQLGILECYAKPERVGEKLIFLKKGPDLQEERVKLYASAFSNFITLNMLEQNYLYAAMETFRYVMNIPYSHGHEYEQLKRFLLKDIVSRTEKHTCHLFSEYMKKVDYEDLEQLYVQIQSQPTSSATNTEWEAMLYYYRNSIIKKLEIPSIDDFLVDALKSLCKENLKDLISDIENSKFDDFLEIYQRKHIQEDIELSVKARLLGYRAWAQENLTKPEHSEEAQRIIEELINADLLVDELVLPE